MVGLSLQGRAPLPSPPLVRPQPVRYRGVMQKAPGSDEIPEPSFAERVRTMLHRGRTGALSTWSAKFEGYPFGSIMPYGVAPDGSPTFFVSSLALHTKNLRRDPRASLLVGATAAEDPLAVGRVTLVGEVVPVEDEVLEAVREDYLARHPSSRAWVGFGDFSFHRLAVRDAWYVAGFGAMGWIDAADLRAASPDPLADAADEIVAHMNEDHADALALYARAFAGLDATSARMLEVDRLGFRLRAETPGEPGEARLAFAAPVATPEEARKALVRMVREARERLGGA